MSEENADEGLDGFFEGEEHDEISTEVESEPAKVETESEDAKPEGEEEAEAKSETTTEEPKTAPMAAVLDERHKRQQLERENEALRAQIPKSKEAPDPYDDIDAYNAFMKREWEQEQYETQTKQRRERIDKLRAKMLETQDDFDEMERIFEIMTANDKSLLDKMLESGNEPKFAYETAKAYKQSLLTPKTETVDEKSNVRELPNLAKATAQASNSTQLEKEADLDDIFEDMPY